MPGKRQTAAEMKEVFKDFVHHYQDVRPTWLRRTETEAKGALSSKGASDSQRRDAISVLALLGVLRGVLETGDADEAAFVAARMATTYERMRWRPFEEPAARALGKGILWGPHYLKLPGMLRKIAVFVQEHPNGNIRDLFPEVWEHQFRPDDRAHRSKLDKAVHDLNAILSEKCIGQIHVKDGKVLFEEYP